MSQLSNANPNAKEVYAHDQRKWYDLMPWELKMLVAHHEHQMDCQQIYEHYRHYGLKDCVEVLLNTGEIHLPKDLQTKLGPLICKSKRTTSTPK